MKFHRFLPLAALLASSAFAQPLTSAINSNEGGHLNLVNPGKTGATTSQWTLFNMTGPYNNGLAFWRYYADGTNAGPSVFFHDNGKVGIGTNSPHYALDVAGVIRNRTGADGYPYTKARIFVYGGDGIDNLNWGYLGYGDDANMRIVYGNESSGHSLIFGTSSSYDNSGVFTPKMIVNGVGNVGIGTTNPRSRLDIGSDIGAGKGVSFGDYFEINEREFINNAVSLGWNAHIAADNGTYAPAWAGAGASGMVLAMDGGGSSNLDFWGKQWTSGEPASLDSFTHVMRLSTNGNVGIGTTNPQHKLSVNGTIKAKEVIVETTGWSDYVFAENYRLAPLSEVEAHITEKKHLPGMPSAAEVTENGVNVAQVQAALLAKVEELTLHLISQEKSLRDLKTENETLKKRMTAYEQR